MPLPFADFFSGKTVLITGHTGFKGAWLGIWLRELGAEVIGYSLEPPTIPSLFQVCRLEKKITSVTADVKDLTTLLKVMKRYRPQIVFHLAAQSLVRRSYREPVETYATNVMGTVNVLEAVRQTESVRIVINVTSDKCYENSGWVWGYRESDAIGGHDPYSSSKGCSELVTTAYRLSYFNGDGGDRGRKALSSARAGNVIGGGDWAEDRLVPDCIRALSDGRPVVMRNPQAVRPWQHVLEPLCGYLFLAKKMGENPEQYAGAWNFGPGDDAFFSVREVVELVISEWGGGTSDVRPDPSMVEANRLKLDSSKARALLGWQPRWDVRTAVKKTVQWYQAELVGRDMYQECRRQIAAYCGED